MDKVTQKTLDMIHKLLKDKNQFDDWYSMPYSDSDDDRVDVHIEYKIKKVLLKNSNPDYLFLGTVIIQPTKVLLGVDDDWEEGFKQHDVSEYMWDTLGEEVIEDIEIILPHVYMIPEFDFTKINS